MESRMSKDENSINRNQDKDMVFNIEGQEHLVSSALVPIGGKLPFYQEMRTSRLLDFLQTLFKSEKDLRKRISRWLSSRTRPGFYLEIKPDLHLAYADQRDGYGTQHWWRLFFDENRKATIEQITQASALVIPGVSSTTSPDNAAPEWGGMMFRSPAEAKIAKALDKQGALFFANVRGRIGLQGSPISKASGELTGSIEVNFLVFYKRKTLSLEIVDGFRHEDSIWMRDDVRDRILLREGIPTARFTNRECDEQPDAVVAEFLNLFWGNHKLK